MTARLLGRFDPGTPEWYAARTNRIGGSEISAVLGLSPYESRFSLWQRKAGRIGPQPENPEMEWGKRLEPAVAAKFCEMHPEYDALMGGQYVHDERDYQIASPDLRLAHRCACPIDDEYGDVLIHDAGCEMPVTSLLEVKTARYGDEWGYEGTAEIPIGYKAQTLWYLDVFDLPSAHVAVLIAGSEYREYVVTADSTEAAFMREAAVEFLATIERGERPDIDGHAETYRALRELHPQIDGTTYEIDVATTAAYLTANAELKAAEWREAQARSAIADQMGEAQKAVCRDHKILRRQARGGGLPYLVAYAHLPTPDELVEDEVA